MDSVREWIFHPSRQINFPCIHKLSETSSEGMSLKLTSGIGLMIAVAFVCFVLVKVFAGSRTTRHFGSWKGGSARLPCLSGGKCPVGQTCMRGFCSEGFTAPLLPSTDMSSCGAKECKGINAPCARSGTPCGEGTFCQGNACVGIAAPDRGEAYKQIGTLLE
jgi:hypothetical protein